MKQINWVLLLISVIGVQWFYLPTRLSGFVTDFTGLAERIEFHGAAGIASSFGFPALQPLTSIFYYLFYHFFSLDGWGWYLSATLLHTANALFLFLLVRRLLKDESTFVKQAIAGLGALLFLFSPYATEVVVWRVGFHYLLVTFLSIAVLWWTQSWLEHSRARKGWWVLGLQTAALMTYELAIILPLLSLCLILWQAGPAKLRQAIYSLVVPQFSLIGLYFLANRLFLGNWIGHYGSEVHLKFPLTEMTANIGRYFMKWVGFSRYWPHAWKETLAQELAQPLALVVCLVLLGIFSYFLFKSFGTSNRKGSFILFFGSMALIALLPVLNLYFNVLLHIENDRYGYLASLFFYPAWVALLSRLSKAWFVAIGIGYLLCSIWFLQHTNTFWAQSTEVYRSLLADFDAYDQDSCYLLNLPDNLQGAPMFRDYSGQGRAFSDALRYVQKKPYLGQLKEVVQYNMGSPADGVQLTSDSTGLVVTFNQWGNWWWRQGVGASNYRDSSYHFFNEGHSYRLEWQRKPEESQVLYQSEGIWKEADID